MSPCSCVVRAILVTDCADVCCRGPSPVYELYGVVVHCASNGKTLESGHYVNFIRLRSVCPRLCYVCATALFEERHPIGRLPVVLPAAGHEAYDQMLLKGKPEGQLC